MRRLWRLALPYVKAPDYRILERPGQERQISLNRLGLGVTFLLYLLDLLSRGIGGPPLIVLMIAFFTGAFAFLFDIHRCPQLVSSLREKIGRIKESAQSELTLVDNLLDYARLETNQVRLCPTRFAAYDLLVSAATIVAASAEKKNLQLHLFSLSHPTCRNGWRETRQACDKFCRTSAKTRQVYRLGLHLNWRRGPRHRWKQHKPLLRGSGYRHRYRAGSTIDRLPQLRTQPRYHRPPRRLRPRSHHRQRVEHMGGTQHATALHDIHHATLE
jgi:hypothetical protein